MKIVKMEHDEYVRVQKHTTNQKLGKVGRHWVSEAEIDMMADYLKKVIGQVSYGLCHGVRNGWEVQEFKKRLGGCIIGTDISDAAAKYADVVCHDFHEPFPEWDGRADFVYSNSLDHSYDPNKALACWMRSLKPGGRLLVSWSTAHDESGITPHNGDIFGASRDEYRLMMEGHGITDAELEIKGRVIFAIKRPE